MTPVSPLEQKARNGIYLSEQTITVFRDILAANFPIINQKCQWNYLIQQIRVNGVNGETFNSLYEILLE